MTNTVYADDVAFGSQPDKVAERAAHERARKGKRIRLFLMLFSAALMIAAATAGYLILIASKHVVTNNAYVGANVADVTPLVGGPVKDVLVDDTQFVKRGQLLVRFDDTDAQIALAKAEADLSNSERRVRGLVATDTGLSAQITARIADQARASAQLAAAKGDVERARIDFARRQDLASTGSVSGEEITTAQNAFTTANANLKAAEAALALANANRSSAVGTQKANNALIQNTSIDTNPEVLAARAVRDQAEVNLDRTIIRAPVDGVVSQRDVQIGRRVQAGDTMMTIVPIARAYVDANFKEVQLAKVHPGQPVTLVSDLYGRRVKYHGRVAGFSGGTGAAFAIVPAQNATGNWIKVVQRLPVRIELDPKELAQHPLRVGLSMDVDIDVAR